MSTVLKVLKKTKLQAIVPHEEEKRLNANGSIKRSLGNDFANSFFLDENIANDITK